MSNVVDINESHFYFIKMIDFILILFLVRIQHIILWTKVSFRSVGNSFTVAIIVVTEHLPSRISGEFNFFFFIFSVFINGADAR